MFGRYLAGVGRTARGADFDFHAGKTFGKSLFEIFSQFRARRHARNNFAFLLG